MGKIIDRIVNAERVEDLIAVFGSFDENIRRIEESIQVSIVNRGSDLKITGDEEAVDKAARTIEGLLSLASKGELIDEQRVRYLITLVNEGTTRMYPRWQRMLCALPQKASLSKLKLLASKPI